MHYVLFERTLTDQGGFEKISKKKYAFAIFVVLTVVNYGGLKIFSLKIWGIENILERNMGFRLFAFFITSTDWVPSVKKTNQLIVERGDNKRVEVVNYFFCN